MAGRARGFHPFAGLPRARRRVPSGRAVPVPAEDRAPTARARGREPRLPRLGADLARAPLARASRARQRRAPASPRARLARRQPGRAPARRDLPRSRLPAARDDPAPELDRGRRRAGPRATRGGGQDRRAAEKEGRGPALGLAAAAGSAAAGGARAAAFPVQHALADPAHDHQIADAAREGEEHCHMRVKLSHLS